MEEQVLVVRTEAVKPLLNGTFSSQRNDEVLSYILSNYTFLKRDLAENDPSYKQVIPYVLVRHGNKYLMLKRTSGQTEKRLHNKVSLGVGGHINPEPNLGRHANIIEAGLHRELQEEVSVRGNHRLRLLGAINDDSTEVGQVHLGLAFLLESDSPQFEVNEKELMTAEWADVDQINDAFDRMETWSQILVKNCIQKSA